ncbi:TetR/AcrR family transcriptional regulator [Nocardia sp. NEAU-G5]|uniref:TetR/AcrR family transcriptional regulator n=1 Tax=Nocardia albiluteola TaxID=2842303 RepID=A0ABS6AZU0_9NOCA|nr:TetR/AcrR family transcriptional regulator [Nocardia albiluteola]MBU3063576.1 TetR/AcrR family transcriptional regulator [Nocardia albiluteola]
MPMGRPRSFDREAALERAVDVFWEHGYDATSIALLCERMAISTPSLYSAFGDKRALFLEALDRYLHTYGAFTAQALAEEPTAYGAISRLLHEAAGAYTRPQHPAGCLLITATTNCTPQSADLKTHLSEIRRAATEALEQKVRTGITAGELPADTDSHALALFYGATIQGMSATARDGGDRADLDAIAATALHAWPRTPSRPDSHRR